MFASAEREREPAQLVIMADVPPRNPLDTYKHQVDLVSECFAGTFIFSTVSLASSQVCQDTFEQCRQYPAVLLVWFAAHIASGSRGFNSSPTRGI
jgi:hypothetical protein